MNTQRKQTTGTAALAVCLFCMLLLAAQALAQTPEGYVQKTEKGSIDWLSGEVQAKGIGAPPPDAVNAAQARAMALRAATVIARRNLLELLEGVQIDSATTVRNYMVDDDTVITRVKGHLQQATVKDTAYMSDGSVEVVVQVNLRGRLSQTLLPQAGQGARPSEQAGPERMAPAATTPEPRPARPAIPDGPSVATSMPASDGGSFAPSGTTGGYTGLVVDARGLGVRPAMSPRILDEQGNEVYGSSFVGREYAIQQGMAGYAKSPEQAAASDRVAGNPLLVEAKAVSGQAKTDIVVADDVARRIRAAASNSEILEQCRVMIVLD